MLYYQELKSSDDLQQYIDSLLWSTKSTYSFVCTHSFLTLLLPMILTATISISIQVSVTLDQ